MGSNQTASRTFDVIVTSNLVDHLGCLNLLAATRPLLTPKSTSVICTEMQVLREESVEKNASDLLCGDLPTVALLFGLTPIQYWTHASATPIFDEGFMETLQDSNRTSVSVQSRYIVVWKNTDAEPACADKDLFCPGKPVITFDAKELANPVFRMCLRMFLEESWDHRMQQGPSDIMRKQYEHYTRASLCAILCLIRNAKRVEWESFINQLCDRVMNSSTLNALYLEELFLHLHLLDLHTMPRYEPGLQGLIVNLEKSPLKGWRDIPRVVCLTLVVPRQKNAYFQATSARE